MRFRLSAYNRQRLRKRASHRQEFRDECGGRGSTSSSLCSSRIVRCAILLFTTLPIDAWLLPEVPAEAYGYSARAELPLLCLVESAVGGRITSLVR